MEWSSAFGELQARPTMPRIATLSLASPKVLPAMFCEKILRNNISVFQCEI